MESISAIIPRGEDLRFVYTAVLQYDYSNRATWPINQSQRYLAKQNFTWEQRIAIL